MRARASEPLSPAESLKKIHTSPGYRVELVASEPLVFDPVAIDWDACPENCGSSKWRIIRWGWMAKANRAGAFACLRTRMAMGIYDKSHLFAEGLNFPTGLITLAGWRGLSRLRRKFFFCAIRMVMAAPMFARFCSADSLKGTNNSASMACAGVWIIGSTARWVAIIAATAATTKIKSHLTGQQIALGSRDCRFQVRTPANSILNRGPGAIRPQSRRLGPLVRHAKQPSTLALRPWPIATFAAIRTSPPPDPTVQVMVPANPQVFPASAEQKRYHSFEHKGHFTSGCSGMIYRDDLLFPANEMHAFACEPVHDLVHHEIVSRRRRELYRASHAGRRDQRILRLGKTVGRGR